MSRLRTLNLFLVRHALSAANLDKEVNVTLPDQEVPLAPQGAAQAKAAGHTLAGLLSGRVALTSTPAGGLTTARLPGRTRVLCSPYTRTRQTAEHIRAELTAAGVAHDYREELALREISFGLFDGVPDEELPVRFPNEHAHYAKHLRNPSNEFWASMPMGESRAQVADRVKGVFGTILRDNSPDRDSPVQNFVVVSHGVTLRAFVMQWLHRPFEQFGSNPANCSIHLIAGQGTMDGPRYRHGVLHPGFSHTRHSEQDLREAEGRVP